MVMSSRALVKNRKKDITSTNINLPSQTTQKPTPRPEYKFSKPAVSANNDLFFKLVSKKENDRYTFDINMAKHPSGGLIVVVDGRESQAGTLFTFTDNQAYFEKMMLSFEKYIAWSPNKKKFAVMLPNEVVVYEYETETLSNDSWTPPRQKMTLHKLHQIKVTNDNDSHNYPVILFSGDGKILYYSNNTEIKTLLPTEKSLVTTENVSDTIYQVPNSSGVAYWVSDNKNPSDNIHTFVIDNITSKEKYSLKPNFIVDYDQEIILAPDLSKVCMGWGSSGSTGKILFDLRSGKQLEIGTGCLRWINKDQIITTVSDYSNSGIVSYYLVNLLNGSKMFLHNFNIPN